MSYQNKKKKLKENMNVFISQGLRVFAYFLLRDHQRVAVVIIKSRVEVLKIYFDVLLSLSRNGSKSQET